jgi:hypothetical protein
MEEYTSRTLSPVKRSGKDLLHALGGEVKEPENINVKIAIGLNIVLDYLSVIIINPPT